MIEDPHVFGRAAALSPERAQASRGAARQEA